MDYFSLYESFGIYKVDLGSNPVFALCVGVCCIIIGVVLLSLSLANYSDNKAIAVVMGVPFLVTGAVLIMCGTRMKSPGNRLEALNSAAFEGCGDSIENVVYNVEYLSDRYDERLDYFKFAYGDDVPSRKEYINNVLNEFYGQTVSSDRVNYRDEIKEVEQSLIKGIQWEEY